MATIVLAVNYKPVYNWDILPYMALALNNTVDDKDSVHKEVYRLIKAGQEKGEVPNGTFGELTKRIPYRIECYENADKFNAQLFYYRTKPLYNLLVYLLYATGVPLLEATFLPSLIGCFFVLLILYAWMSLYTSGFTAILVTVLTAMLPLFSELQNTSSPDALSAMFVLLSMYLLFSGKARGWIWLSLALAILIRIDNFIFAAVILFVVLKPHQNRLFALLILFLATALIAVIVVPWLSGNSLLWFTRFRFLESHVQYYFHVRNVFRAFFGDAYYWIWVTACIVLLNVKYERVQKLMFIITASVLVRLVLFPSLQERFFAPYELALIVASLMAVNGRMLSPKEIRQVPEAII